MSEPAKAITIYVDADACPVKAEIYRVAERYAIKVYVVSNSPMAIPRTPLIERVVVGSNPDAADDWIAERVSRGDIVITADVPLAASLRKGRGGRDRAYRARADRSVHRHGARDTQFDGRFAFGRANHRRPEAVPAA